MKIWLAAVLPNVLVLGSLGGLAFWGHETDWTFIHFVPHGTDHAKQVRGEHSPDAHDAITLEAEQSLQSLGVKLGKAVERPMEETVRAHGMLTYDATKIAQLSARVPGVVWRVEKRVGDHVHQGEVLAILDAAAVGQAKTNFLNALVRAELTQRNFEYVVAVGDAVPAKRRREAEAAYREAVVHRFDAQQTLINLGLPIQHQDLVELSDEERAKHIHFLGLPENVVANLNRATTTANLIPIVAPFDGLVIRREIVTGEVVRPEQTQLVIADVQKMWLKMNVRKEDSARLAVGQLVEFQADGLPGELTSYIDWVSTEVDDRTRTVQVIATFDNPVVADGDSHEGHRLLKANTFGSAQVRVRETPLAIATPSTAVQWDGEKHIVFVPAAHDATAPDQLQFLPLTVQIGVTQDDFTEIVSGLKPGDVIVIDGAHLFKSELKRRRETPAGQVVTQADGT